MEMEEGIAMAGKVLMTISKDEIERARLMSEYKNQLDIQSKMVYVKRMGIQEGLQKGLQKGLAEGYAEKFEIARNLVKMGLPVETIVSATGLDPEKVKTLTKEE
jgi:predicted transposase/invertase (TIGR01784 family)